MLWEFIFLVMIKSVNFQPFYMMHFIDWSLFFKSPCPKMRIKSMVQIDTTCMGSILSGLDHHCNPIHWMCNIICYYGARIIIFYHCNWISQEKWKVLYISYLKILWKLLYEFACPMLEINNFILQLHQKVVARSLSFLTFFYVLQKKNTGFGDEINKERIFWNCWE